MHHYVTQGYVLPNQMHIYWTMMIVLYPYITGIVAGAFIISSLHHVFGKDELKPVSRFSMMMALAFLLCAPLPLLAHLGHPERALNIMFTPNVTSAMAGFGFIYSIYLLILTVEIWLLYRVDIVFLAGNAKSEMMRRLYWVMALGVTDISEEAKALDRKVMLILAAIGVPAACFLHGYVGFLFGAIKANPWWASPLMPVIFLLSAIVSGVAMVMVCYLIVQWFNKRPVDSECTQSLMESAWYFLMVDVALEGLELLNHAYMANHDWDILRHLIVDKLFVSLFVVQFLIGSVVPFVLLGTAVVFKNRFSAGVRQRDGLRVGSPAPGAGRRHALERGHGRADVLKELPRIPEFPRRHRWAGRPARRALHFHASICCNADFLAGPAALGTDLDLSNAVAERQAARACATWEFHEVQVIS